MNIEDYERELQPGLIDVYERGATARSSAARPSAAAPRRSRRGARRRSPTTASSSAARDIKVAESRRTVPGTARSRSTSTGSSTTSRWPTSARARDDDLPPRAGVRGGVSLIRHRAIAAPKTDHEYLARAIELAANGVGRVHPNPVVGAVIARDGEVLGEGWHDELRRPARRASRRSPPRRGRPARRDDVRVARAVLPPGQAAPMHRRDRRGRASRASWWRATTRARRPRAAGWASCATRASRSTSPAASCRTARGCANQAFRKHARTGRPWVLFKSAMTLDGKVATPTGDSKWISGEPAARARAPLARGGRRRRGRVSGRRWPTTRS